MKPIDVVVLTKDSERLLGECLESIYENVPVDRLIVVDGLSADNTMKIIKKYQDKHRNIEVVAEDGSRAKARQVGIQRVQTPWFMFVDSDAILCKDWAERAETYIKNDVGAVWGLNIDVVPRMNDRFLLRSIYLIARECFKIRGGMHDTLIRRDLVEDIKIPEQLHTYEDAYIVNWIKKKGFKVVPGDELYCLHFGPDEDTNLKKTLDIARLEIRCGLIYSHTYKYALYYPFFVYYSTLRFLDRNFSQRLTLKTQNRS